MAIGLFAVPSLQAQVPRDFAIDLSATVSTNTPCVSLAWTQRRQGNITAQKIHRRLKGEVVWVKQADLTTNQTSYVDNTAVPYTEYEYWMERTYSSIYPTTAMGYLSAGVRVPMAEDRGKLLLVIDSTMVTPLAPEIAQLQADLTGDGWTVQTITATRTDTAINTKALIKAAYDADPVNLKMVYLLGHVAVPYSGNIAPDGHGNHVGAWPADGYYGDMDGTWTDTSVNNTSAGDTRNRNIPGDGKFDQSNLPSPVELMVGRVDLANMTRAPVSSVSETSLLRRYLRKAHDFKFKQGAYAAIPRRSMLRNGFGYFSGENFAIAGWSWMFTGVGNTVDEPPSDQWFSPSYAGGKSYLVGYGDGGGSWDTAGGVGNSADFGLKTSRVVFTSLFGSYFGDWDSANNFMRAPLAGNATGDSLGLTCFWGGRPNRVTHHMGMGETAGYAMMVSHNSALSGGGGYTPNIYAGVHCGLMGDPALRLHAVEPPRNLSASSANTQVMLAWSASTETNLLGYHVYRAATSAGPFTRLTATPLSGTAYTDTTVTAGLSYTYLVRTLKLETSPGGSYNNLSVGTLLTLTANAGASGAPANPAALTVTQNSATNAVLAWTDNAGDETGFRIERKTNAGGSYASIGTTGANVTNFVDPGVFAHGNVYFYRVIATGATGESLPSSEASFEAFAGFFNMPVTRMKISKAVGTAVITVNRFGGVTGPVSVNFATANTSATAGVHYTATNGTLTWADGETNAKTISVSIINTATAQAARQFKVSLSSPSAGTGITINSSIAVLIEDSTAALAAPWSQIIISGITDFSPATLIDGEFSSVTIGGTGLAAGNTYDAGQFIYQSRDGDGVMTAYFPSGLPSDGNARVALMVRASTANNAIMAAAATSANTSFGSLLSTRSAAGSGASVLPASANTLVLARWMRLSRAGNVFTAETSPDGSAWTLLGSVTLSAMPSTAQWGIFHSSSDWSVTGLGNYQLAQAQNVTLSGLPIPLAPTGLVAVASSPSSVTLTWDSVANAAGYRIERCTETGTFTQIADIATVSGNTQAYVDSGLPAEAVYIYRVAAYNASGTSVFTPLAYVATPSANIVTAISTDASNSADATVRQLFPDLPLGTQTNLTVSGYDPDDWSVTNAAKTYLRFDLAGVGTFTSAKLKLAYVGESRFVDAGFFCLYFYLLAESSDTWNENTITWNTAPQNNLTGVGFSGASTYLGYTNFYTIPAEGEVLSFDLPASAINSNLGANNLVTLGLNQYNAGAIVDWASREHASFSPPTLELSVSSPLPTRASFLSATPGNGWSVVLQWRDNAANETGFELERSAAGGAFTLVQSLTSNTVSVIDATAQPDVTYAYRVRAVNAAGNSPWTPVATITTPDLYHARGTLWDGDGANTFIDTPTNWDLNACPALDGSLYFSFGSGGSIATINTNAGFLGFCFNRDADFTLADGGGTLTLGSGGLRAAAPGAVPRTYTLASKVALASSQTWCVTNTGAGATSLVISGPVSDGDSVFGITKTGDGPLTLSGNNTYDGPTAVTTGGILRVAHNNALGSTNGATIVDNGGGLEVNGSVTVSEPLTLSGEGAQGSAGALFSTSGTNVWCGPISQGTVRARIGVANGSSLTLAGGVTGSGITLSPDTNACLSVTGNPVNFGTNNIYAYGAGTLALCSTGNTWNVLDVSGLTVRTDVTNALPASSILSIGSATSPNGTVDLNGNNQTVAQFKSGSAAAGNRLVTSAVPATLRVNQSGATTSYDGQLTGALSLNKSGTGRLTLSGTNNTYSGNTTVSAGILTISSISSLGNSSVITVEGGTLTLQTSSGIADNATLRIADGGAKVSISAGVVETVDTLQLGAVRKQKGTWGSSSSPATNIDNAHFSGSGVINVSNGSSTQWDGGSANANVNVPENWDYDACPPFNGTAYLTFGIGGEIATVNTNISLFGIRFNREADFALAAAGGTLTLGSGGLRADVPTATSRTYTIAVPTAIATNQSWGITNAGAGVTTLVVSGPVSDGSSAFGITKTGDGILTLSGDNTYDGPTVVTTGGVLRVSHSNALGNTNGNTTVENGGWLEVSGNITVPEPLILNGEGPSGGVGALFSTGGTNTWSGPVFQDTFRARIGAVGGSCLKLAGGLISPEVTLSPDTGSTLTITDKPLNVGSSNVYAFGLGTLIISSTGNTWNMLEVAGLTVRTDVTNALPTNSVLSLGSDAASPNGTVDLNGNSQTVAQFKSGTTTAGNRLVTSANPATLTINQSGTTTTYDGQLTGALSLRKSGTGRLTLSSTNNTYSGDTVVSAGILYVSSISRLGNSLTVTVEGGTLTLLTSRGIADDAALRIADSGAKVSLNAGVVETVGTLQLGGVRKRRGTWGSSTSPATNKDNVHFSGSGVINVLHGPETIFLIQ